MTITVKENNINYIQYGSGKDIVLLHGWGQNIEMMNILGKELNDCRITILDFPGFGESDEPKEPLDIYQYTEILEDFLKQLNIKNPIVIGHSFGGRVGIIFASRNETEKLVLFGSPCVREERTSKKESFLKKVKKLPGMNKIGEIAKKYIGSEDYKNASPVMRNTLVNVINQDLSKEAKQINCPTLLIWGTLDTAAPLEDAKKMEQLLKDGALIEIPGCTHYAYIEALPQVVNILKEFMR